jgi:arylsulfatase A-like enzyme
MMRYKIALVLRSAALLGVSLACASIVAEETAKTTKPSRPNILFFHADQHNARVMGCAGHPEVKTPWLDRLAAEGVQFERAYCQAGICTPSRTSLMTGLYPRTTGVVWNSAQDDGQVHAGVRIEPMAAWFKNQGHRTAAIGRRHLADAADVGWDRTATTYDHRCDESYQEWLRETGNWEAFQDDSDYKNMELHGHVTRLPPEATEEAWMARKTIALVRQAAQDGRPFFCWVPYLHPHHSYAPLAQFYGLYDPEKLTLPANLHEPLEDLPPPLRRFRSGENNPWCLGRAAKDESIFRRFLACYYGCVSQVDDSIGQILTALKETGQLENTIVIFTADHGDFAAYHGLVEKFPWAHNVYEEIVRVPFIVSWPARLRKGEVRQDLIEETDIYPTLLELAGVEGPKDYPMVGRSLVPTLTRGESVGRRYAFSETSIMATVITDRYKLGVFLVEQDGNFPDMLFDRNADPLEVHNLCGQPEAAEVEKELREALAAWMARTPAVEVKTRTKMPNGKPAVLKKQAGGGP